MSFAETRDGETCCLYVGEEDVQFGVDRLDPRRGRVGDETSCGEVGEDEGMMLRLGTRRATLQGERISECNMLEMYSANASDTEAVERSLNEELKNETHQRACRRRNTPSIISSVPFITALMLLVLVCFELFGSCKACFRRSPRGVSSVAKMTLRVLR